MTETGWLIAMVDDLMLVAAGHPVIGDDAGQHRLTYGGDGASPVWSCTCGAWEANADDTDLFDAAHGYLHHAYPSRYGARLSTIMAVTLRSLRQSQSTTHPTR